MSTINFEYFYDRDCDAFRYIKVPAIFFEEEAFRNLSSDAKLMYSLLLNRTALSYKNGWIDKNRKVYIIFPIEEIQRKFMCSNKTAVKILDELDSKKGGIGLIERVRQGLGKPNIIYVKNFMAKDFIDRSRGVYLTNPEVEKLPLGSVEFTCQEMENVQSLNVKDTLHEMKNLQGINTDISNTDLSKTDFSYDAETGLHGVFKNVRLNIQDIQELQEIMGVQLENYIQRLSSYMKSTGKQYADHKATLLLWFHKDEGKKLVEDEKKRVPTHAEYNKGDHL